MQEKSGVPMLTVSIVSKVKNPVAYQTRFGCFTIDPFMDTGESPVLMPEPVFNGLKAYVRQYSKNITITALGLEPVAAPLFDESFDPREFVSGSVDSVVDSLNQFNAEQLAALLAEEKQGKKRSSMIKAISDAIHSASDDIGREDG